MPESFEDEEGDWVSLGEAVAPVMRRVFEMMTERQAEAEAAMDARLLGREAA
jgi:hypothetical protein